MDRQKVSKLLDKINRLFQTLDQPDPMERDLMMSYIRQLYEEFYFQEKKQDTYSPTKPQNSFSPPPPKYQAPEVNPPTPKYANPEPKPASRPYTAPQPEPRPRHEPKPAPKPEPQRVVPPTPSTRADQSQFAPLFEVENSNELAQKLRNSPINDLNQAFTINDRLLFTNELFSKDQQSFQRSLGLLNNYQRFDEAKFYLCDLASQYSWMTKGRLETAKDFIKTIRRRYPA